MPIEEFKRVVDKFEVQLPERKRSGKMPEQQDEVVANPDDGKERGDKIRSIKLLAASVAMFATYEAITNPEVLQDMAELVPKELLATTAEGALVVGGVVVGLAVVGKGVHEGAKGLYNARVWAGENIPAVVEEVKAKAGELSGRVGEVVGQTVQEIGATAVPDVRSRREELAVARREQARVEQELQIMDDELVKHMEALQAVRGQIGGLDQHVRNVAPERFAEYRQKLDEQCMRERSAAQKKTVPEVKKPSTPEAVVVNKDSLPKLAQWGLEVHKNYVWITTGLSDLHDRINAGGEAINKGATEAWTEAQRKLVRRIFPDVAARLDNELIPGNPGYEAKKGKEEEKRTKANQLERLKQEYYALCAIRDVQARIAGGVIGESEVLRHTRLGTTAIDDLGERYRAKASGGEFAQIAVEIPGKFRGVLLGIDGKEPHKNQGLRYVINEMLDNDPGKIKSFKEKADKKTHDAYNEIYKKLLTDEGLDIDTRRLKSICDAFGMNAAEVQADRERFKRAQEEKRQREGYIRKIKSEMDAKRADSPLYIFVRDVVANEDPETFALFDKFLADDPIHAYEVFYDILTRPDVDDRTLVPITSQMGLNYKEANSHRAEKYRQQQIAELKRVADAYKAAETIQEKNRAFFHLFNDYNSEVHQFIKYNVYGIEGMTDSRQFVRYMDLVLKSPEAAREILMRNLIRADMSDTRMNVLVDELGLDLEDLKKKREEFRNTAEYSKYVEEKRKLKERLIRLNQLALQAKK